MSLDQSLAQLVINIRRFTDTGGVSARERHPDASLYDYTNRALGSLHRLLTSALPDQRILAGDTITTADGTSLYDLPRDFESLISIDLSANGYKSWLIAYEMHERPMLTSPQMDSIAVSSSYRLHGATQIEYLPTPRGIYTSQLWYVPTATQLSAGDDTFDTINRLDDYVIPYASRPIAVRDKNWELVAECKRQIDEFRAEVLEVARKRDRNSPSRIVDEQMANRWGRTRRFR